ncbi:PREDICTED: C-type lectin Cal-like [Ceratosolen solmsi marchali]|uniref:C-type lectin Cal-like n=1 Tax=Ceratosolen solmsi marchali TaxID=326594 RepID=A0AAJ6YPE9_9HYME|nr:PREDICTED: C-type lectin Cal-like [Ceratosolen solmsi marchali]
MEIQLLNRAFVVCFVMLPRMAFVKGHDFNVKTASTTTEKSALVGSLENIVTEVQSMKARIDKILIETSTTNFIEKTRHNVLAEKGYRFTSGIGYHRLYTTKLTWHDALHFCRKEKAHLAVIDSSAEGQALGEIIKELIPSETDGQSIAYIGIHDYCRTGSWITIFFNIVDEHTEYIRWQEGSPNYIFGQEQCAAIDTNGYISTLECLSKRAFFCEMQL